jgi:DNA-binding MarR family transcriptional regulator
LRRLQTRPLERDRLVSIGNGPNGRTRMVKLTAAGEARFKAAAAHWRRAQKEFEAAFGADFARRFAPRCNVLSSRPDAAALS